MKTMYPPSYHHKIKYKHMYIYAIMKIMCPPSYDHKGLLTTHALITGSAHCFHDCICITSILLL